MEFLGVSPGVVTRKQFGKILAVVFVIVVDMTQHIHHPVAEVHIGSLAAPQQLLSFEKWMEKTYPTVLPRSRMGEAISYSYSLWPRMKNYLKDGRIEIDNNLAENAIRPIVVSRKNFLFCGNHEAAQNTAVICSLLTSCKESGVNPREWLIDVISKMPSYQKQGNDENLRALLPNNWKTAGV